MSIIHEALKRKNETAKESPPDIETLLGTAKSRGLSEHRSHLFPALLGGGGVILTALITYLIARPGAVTIVVPPADRAIIMASELEPVAGPSEEFLPVDEMPAEEIPAMGVIEDIAPITPVQENFGIPVYAPLPNKPARTSGPPQAREAAQLPPAKPVVLEVESDNGIPSNAVTIEMTQAKLGSFAGAVTVDGASARPGALLRVGSEIKSTGEASVGFERADVELIGSTAARISRLERRIGRSGTPEEDVTLHLKNGAARALVRPGGGSMLVSTDALTAATQNGAFRIETAPDGSVTVINEGGTVNLIPSARQNEPMTLQPNQRITFRDGAFVAQ